MSAQPPFELALERRFDAPVDRVWKALTEQIDQWWSPEPWTTQIVEIEWRAGGAFNITSRGPAGEEFAGTGVLLEVDPGRSFTFTDALSAGWIPQKPFMVGRFEISAQRDGTLYRAAARHWDEESLEEHRRIGFETGWGLAADQLKRLAER